MVIASKSAYTNFAPSPYCSNPQLTTNRNHTTASFVIEGQGSSLFEEASVQLWLHRRLPGSLVTDTSDFPSPIERSMSTIFIPTPPSNTTSRSTTLQNPPTVDFRSQFSPTETMAHGLGITSISSSPGQTSTINGNHNSHHNPQQPRSSPLPSSPYFQNTHRSQTMTSFGPLSTSPVQDPPQSPPSSNGRRDSVFSSLFKRNKKPRAPSITTTKTQKSSSSSASNTTEATVTVLSPTGRAQTAVIHTKPLKPLLVLFTSNAQQNTRATVVISIDEKTLPNPQRCWCQQGTSPEGGPCKITAIEQCQGAKPLEAKRLQSRSGEWDLLALAAPRRSSLAAEWRGLNRLSILFAGPEARLVFGGTFCRCERQTEGEVLECMRRGHLGLLGMARVLYRIQSTQWYKGRYLNSVHISDRSLGEGPGEVGWTGS